RTGTAGRPFGNPCTLPGWGVLGWVPARAAQGRAGWQINAPRSGHVGGAGPLAARLAAVVRQVDHRGGGVAGLQDADVQVERVTARRGGRGLCLALDRVRVHTGFSLLVVRWKMISPRWWRTGWSRCCRSRRR